MNLGQRFDIVFASHGVLCWIEDISRWFQVAAAHLNPGGFIYLLDGHPPVNVFDGDDPDLQDLQMSKHRAYFANTPGRSEFSYTYAATERIENPISYQWTHSMGDIVNAVVGAGLTIQFLHEFPFDVWQRFKFMKFDGEWWRIEGDPVPLMVSVRASKPI